MTASTPTRGAGSRAGLMRWGAIGVLGLFGFTAFLSFATGARLDSATVGLVFAAGMLVFSLATLFRMVQALARPGRTLAPKAHELAGADRAQLREEKRRLLRAINELKFDFEMGKLSETDFNDVKQTYELRAVEVMRRLDGTTRVHPEVFALLEDRGLADVMPAEAAKEEPEAAKEEPEAAKEEPEAATDELADSDGDVDSGDEGSASEEPGPSELATTITCTACEGENDRDAKFCKHCGKEISA
ncbi:MAG: hypothetical protein ACE37F_20245 [Nannocystaceae bacterium]|nr:zinc ribbon domain-containing protein [bacterium]